MAEKNATAEVKQEGEFSLKGKKTKPKKLVDSSKQDPVKVDLTKPEAQGELVEDITKVDLTEKKEEDAVQAQETNDSNAVIEEPKDSGDSKEVVEKVRDTKEELESPIQEITEEELDEKTMELYEEAEEAVKEQVKQGKPLPENIQSLVDFMNETGGTIEDYVRLNHDYSKVDDQVLIREYYKNTKPHLDQEEISFLIEDQFKYDEEIDEPRDIKKKKLAFKEEIAKARKELDVMKDKYYQEIKLRPGASQEQQKAMDFFNRYNEEQETVQAKHKEFISRTKNLLNNDFEGFDFKVSDKKFRYGIKNPTQVAEAQSDITNFIKTFLNDKNEITDTKGYHKALYAARNADTIAQHFYEQGKADAIKDVMAKSKNISTEPRQTASGDVFVNGLKVKSVSGLDSSKLKIKTKKFN